MDCLLAILLFQAVLNGTVAVDTFFTISGVLLTFIVFKELEKQSLKTLPAFLGKFYFHRYWRVTPPYMLFLMTYVPLFKYLGDGPKWPYDGWDKDECEDTWWTNMLYINTIYKDREEERCMRWTWYLSNDMQFYWVSPIIFLPMHWFGWKGLLMPFIVQLTQMVVTGSLSAANNWGPDLLSADENKDYTRMYYIKPWNRIGPYIVGMVFGWLLYKVCI